MKHNADKRRHWILWVLLAGLSFTCVAQDAAIDACASPTKIDASDGVFWDRVRITWPASPGAAAYQVYRGNTTTFEEAQPVSDWIVETVYDDFTAEPVLSGTITGCYNEGTEPTYHHHYYWVIGQDADGVECDLRRPESRPELGYRGEAGHVTTKGQAQTNAIAGVSSLGFLSAWGDILLLLSAAVALVLCKRRTACLVRIPIHKK